MSHAGNGHDSCIFAISIPKLQFDHLEVARGVTDPGVGSGALLLGALLCRGHFLTLALAPEAPEHGKDALDRKHGHSNSDAGLARNYPEPREHKQRHCYGGNCKGQPHGPARVVSEEGAAVVRNQAMNKVRNDRHGCNVRKYREHHADCFHLDPSERPPPTTGTGLQPNGTRLQRSRKYGSWWRFSRLDWAQSLPCESGQCEHDSYKCHRTPPRNPNDFVPQKAPNEVAQCVSCNDRNGDAKRE